MIERYQPMQLEPFCYHCGSHKGIETDRHISINYGNSLLFISIDYRCDECNQTYINNRYYHLIPTAPPQGERIK